MQCYDCCFITKSGLVFGQLPAEVFKETCKTLGQFKRQGCVYFEVDLDVGDRHYKATDILVRIGRKEYGEN